MRLKEIPALPTSIALFVATCLFQLAFLDRGASLYDEGSIIAIGDNLANGKVLYRDMITFVAPFTYELMGVLYRIFGAHLLVGRLFLIVAFATITVLVHRIFLKLLPPGAALLGALAIWPIKPLGFPVWSILNYSQVALLFKVASLWAAANWLWSHRRGWLVATGLLVGLAITAKQDFGAYVALGITAAVVFDWAIRPPRRLAALATTLISLGLIATIPIGVAFSYYWSLGIGAEFVDRTVLDLIGVRADYSVPFPGLRPWSERPDDLFMIVFAYFPAVFIELAWGGVMNVYDRAQLVPLEVSVKAAYYLPGLAMAWLTVAACWNRNKLAPAERSTLVLIAAVAMVAYMLIFRADWVHLMNLYSIVVLPVAVALARWGANGRVWRRIPAMLVWVAWLGFGAVTTYAICTVFTAPVYTPRGRILDVPRKSADLQRVLDYLDALPADERVLFMPHNPLFYFLTGRPIEAPNDLVMPGLVADSEDDRNLAAAVERADVVVYNPKIFPTAPAPLYAYAPRTAQVLGLRFRGERELSDAAIVLRKIRGHPAPLVVDFWSEAPGGEIEPARQTYIWSDEMAASAPPTVRDHWMVYRVVSMRVPEPEVERCFARRHCVRAGETLRAMPATHPEGWGLPTGKKVAFRISIAGEGGTETAFSGARASNRVPSTVDIPLDRFAGECVEIRFCAAALEQGVARGLAGWAEPRVERKSSGVAGG